MKKDEGKIAIIVAVIEFVGIIVAAFIGVFFVKENSTEMIQKNENIIVLSEEIEELKKQNKELSTKTVENGELDDDPAIEYRNFGLSIDGEEKLINKDKSLVLINGRQYYSKEFVDNLLPPEKTVVEKDDMIYIGKVVKEKQKLIDSKIIENNGVEICEDVKDTYGNVYGNSFLFKYKDESITFNSNREYSKLKLILAVLDTKKGGGVIRIESESEILFTSEEIKSGTEPFLVDIPINQALKITIKNIEGALSGSGSGLDSNVIVADAVFYNEE